MIWQDLLGYRARNLPRDGEGGLATSRRKAVADLSSNSPTGTRLVREWNGKTHHVDVVQSGFVWNGGRYGSLSAIAREITGARWSGPRFFGL
jgi:hypothetical protein